MFLSKISKVKGSDTPGDPSCLLIGSAVRRFNNPVQKRVTSY